VIHGINHVTLSVRDPVRSMAFYRDVLGFRPVARWPKGAYLLAGDLWVALVEDARVRDGALPESTHVAFSVAQADFPAAADRIRSSGSRTWKENESEGDSLYFEDPDGHRLEIHVGDLATRLEECRRNPWPGLEVLD
jgi:glutathione S-transferase fosA5